MHMMFFFFNDTATTEIYTLSLHDALPIFKGPKLERDGCVAWRARDLGDVVERRFGVRYAENGMLRLLKSLDLSWQKARPVHPEAEPKAQERFKKPCPA